MQTAGTVIEKALKRILVQAADAPIEADETADALAHLNDYMASLETRGIVLGYTPVDNVADFVTIPDGAINGIVANLAVEMAGDYDGQVSPSLLKQADDGMRAVRRLGRAPMTTLKPQTLPIGSGNHYHTLAESHYRKNIRAMLRLVEGFTNSFTGSDVPARLLGEWEPQIHRGLAAYVSGRVQNRSQDEMTVTAKVDVSLSGAGGTYTLRLVKNGVSQSSGSAALSGGVATISFTHSLTLEQGEWLEIWVEADTSPNDVTATLGEFRVE